MCILFRGTYFSQHGRSLIDTTPDQVLIDKTIFIKGDRITAITPSFSTEIPEGAKLIDLSRAAMLPELIDVHTHLTSDPRQPGYKSLGISNIRAALNGARAACRTIKAGFTTVRNMGADGCGDVALRDAINDGDIVGPRMLISADAIGIQG